MIDHHPHQAVPVNRLESFRIIITHSTPSNKYARKGGTREKGITNRRIKVCYHLTYFTDFHSCFLLSCPSNWHLIYIFQIFYALKSISTKSLNQILFDPRHTNIHVVKQTPIETCEVSINRLDQFICSKTAWIWLDYSLRLRWMGLGLEILADHWCHDPRIKVVSWLYPIDRFLLFPFSFASLSFSVSCPFSFSSSFSFFFFFFFSISFFSFFFFFIPSPSPSPLSLLLFFFLFFQIQWCDDMSTDRNLSLKKNYSIWMPNSIPKVRCSLFH